MAHAFKRKGIWYIRYKDEIGKWNTKSCSKDANKTDADYLAREYSAKELNRHHKAPDRIVTSNLEQALILFRDTVVPRSTMGIDKHQSSIRREQATVNNIIAFVHEKYLEQFSAFDKDMAQTFLDKRAAEGMSDKTRREERRQLRKFFKWAIKQNYCAENPTDEIVAPKLTKKNPRFFSMEELKKIFEMARGPCRLVFMFLYLTGLRTGELCTLIESTQKLHVPNELSSFLCCIY
jgi:integrase